MSSIISELSTEIANMSSSYDTGHKKIEGFAKIIITISGEAQISLTVYFSPNGVYNANYRYYTITNQNSYEFYIENSYIRLVAFPETINVPNFKIQTIGIH